jgi:DNA-directed RNA polymerase beta' subunit
MNLHAPQSLEAATELEEIAAVPHQIISPRHALPLIGIVQDTLVGSYRLTREKIRFNRREFMNLMMWNKKFDGTLPAPKGAMPEGNNKWTGHQILSQLLPPINFNMANSSKKKVVIQEGEVLEGQFDKSIYSKASKGIIHVTFNDYGSKDTVNLIDSLQTTIEQFLVYNGFSVGVSDLIADSTTKEEMQKKIQDKKSEVESMLLHLHQDIFDNNTGKTNQEEFEDKVFGILNKALTDAGDAGQASLAEENRMTAMVRAGSKGGPINIAQMIACVGQQNVEGKRIPYGFEDRTLPHFKRYDDGAAARGFIENSFISGLSPTEFFFHAMSGREGLIDTAVKTAQTGYIQRQLVKSMEDLVVHYDGTVRDANKNIAQFHYGEDGISATKIESQSLDITTLSNEQIEQEYGLNGVDLTPILAEGLDRGNDSVLLADYVEEVKGDRKMLVEEVFRYGQPTSIYAAVNLERLLLNMKTKFGLNPEQRTNLIPSRVLAGIKSVLEKTQSFHKMWAALLRHYLSPMRIIVKERFTESAFDSLCEILVTKNWQAWVQPGEQVGIIAAQSIGEPATQMTLNSVDWDTKIMIAKNGKIITPQIGEFIDNYYNSLEDKTKVQELPNNQIYIPLDDGNDWKAVSCDEDGKMVWTKLEAITRHPVVNDDGTNTILEVELESGRTVKATKAKSFLTLQNGKILDINGSELKIGDELPIANSLSLHELEIINEINLRDILSPKEYLYGSDALLAFEQMNGNDRHWFQKNQGKLFNIPYTRSDAFRDAFEHERNSNAKSIIPGHVYPKRTRMNVSQIPETIPLTQEFGYFVGAYLAEGMSNITQISITNNDISYLEPIQKFMESWNVGTHIVSCEKEAMNSGIKGTSTSLVIHSTILSKVMSSMFGRVSYEKKLPDWVLQAPDTFVKGLVNAYICGDGTVNKVDGTVSFSSVSFNLVEGVRALFARYNIFTTQYSYIPNLSNFNSVSRSYCVNIPTKYSNIFHSTFNLSMKRKQEILDSKFTKRKEDTIKCKRAEMNNVVWDKIKSIKEIHPMGEGWVYDITVESTRNFMTYSMVNLKDTFHLAGVASKSNVTRGVPRLNELLKVTQNPKAVSLTIPLKPEYSNSIAKAREVAQDLELTLLRDMTLKTAIYYDPKDNNSVLKEDRELLAFYNLFEIEETQTTNKWSKWILRIELDRQMMFNKNITMDDILFVLRRRFEDGITLIYSDFNSQKLVMRIRMSDVMMKQEKGGLTPGDLDALSSYKKLQNKVLNSVIIRGLPGIKAVTFRKGNSRFYYNKSEGKYDSREEYILDTDGSNFLEVLNHPAVDATRVYSTHVHDIYGQLGIEATRAVLLNEITTLFEEGQINYRHLGLLTDVMCRAGRLMSVDRYGINKLDIGPLAKASFEETERILLKAAVFGEIDPITGVSANIMTGQPIRGGTAFADILLDEVAVMNLQKGLPAAEPLEGDEPLPSEEVIMKELEIDPDDYCNAANLRMNMTLPKAKAIVEDEPDVDFVEISSSE